MGSSPLKTHLEKALKQAIGAIPGVIRMTVLEENHEGILGTISGGILVEFSGIFQ